jgi:3-hydroxyisobutyrate dehydrogenase-like beta-hydroxyacid dehydrogenase
MPPEPPESPEPIKVGVLGTGAMGSRFAIRLSRQGYEVHAYNRTAARVHELGTEGVITSATPRELAESTDFIVCMVWDSDAVRSVMNGPAGLIAGLRAGQVIADASTVEPAVSRSVADAVATTGARLLDTPVSGSLPAAESGQLLMMASGDADAYQQIHPVLCDLASVVTYVGPVSGTALVLKLAINLQVAIQEIAFGEALALAEANGIDHKQAIDVMLDSVIASPMLKYRAPFVLEPPAEVWASCDLLLKDVTYAIGHSSHGLVFGQHAARLLELLRSQGRGDREAAELILAVAHGELKEESP